MFEVNNLGVITQDTSELNEEAKNILKAFGNDINIEEAGTPQGQMAIDITTALVEAQASAVKLANASNILSNTGAEIDTTGLTFGYFRKEMTKTLVYCKVSGTNGTVIPIGSKASNGSNEFELIKAITIENGIGYGYFQCTVGGAIPCLVGELNTIVDNIQGWDTITNEVNGVVGVERESDNDFKQRITANWLNIRAKGTMGAIIDSVAQLNDVVSVVGNENYEDITKVVDGITMKSHSIYLSVLGGSGEDIAKVLATKKNNGCGVNGDTEISYFDAEQNFLYTYVIFRPTQVEFDIKISYKDNRFTIENVEDNITEYINNYIALNPFKINQTVNDGYFYNILKDYNLADIITIKVKRTGGSYEDYFTTTVLEYPQLANINFEKVV